MSNKFHLLVQTQDGNEHQLQYQSADNPIANEWMKKIKHISKLPLDEIYTSKNDSTVTKELLNSNISKDIELLNNSIGKIYDVKPGYNQQDCNLLHAYTIDNQYTHPLEIRNIFHRLHRQVHLLEDIISDDPPDLYGLNGEWGEAGGLLTTMHNGSQYQYYTLKMFSGNMYQRWAEFGKPPYTYWKDQDLEDQTHFIDTCKPHVTFRPGFVLCIKDHAEECYDAEFESWFKKYQKVWQEKYNTPDISAYGLGSILLAEPLEDYHDIFSKIYTMKSIKLVS